MNPAILVLRARRARWANASSTRSHPARALPRLAALILAALVAACSSTPLVSRKGISGLALGEMGTEALIGLAGAGGVPAAPGPDFGTFATSDTRYIGGIIPYKAAWLERDTRVDNGTRLFVNGRKRGFLPQILKLPKPGPHLLRLEIPAFQPHEIPLRETIRLRMGQTEVEAWPPVIVDCLTGEIFTTTETTRLDPDRNSGTRGKTDLRSKVTNTPILIVTTTEMRHPGWRKIGEMRAAWSNGTR